MEDNINSSADAGNNMRTHSSSSNNNNSSSNNNNSRRADEADDVVVVVQVVRTGMAALARVTQSVSMRLHKLQPRRLHMLCRAAGMQLCRIL